MRKTLLVVDDDPVFNALLCRQLEDMGFGAQGADSWRKAQARLQEMEPAAIILDYKLPDKDGAGIIDELRGQYPIIVLTGFGSIRNAVSVIRQGAADYLTKPVDLDEFELTVRRVLENAELRELNRFYRSRLASQRAAPMIGDSPAMQEVRADRKSVV